MMGVTRRGMDEGKGGGLAVIVTVVLGCIFFTICILGARDMDRQIAAERASWNYEICMSNWVGSTCSFCDTYEKKDNTYVLYDDDKKIISEMTLTDGYVINVRKTNVT